MRNAQQQKAWTFSDSNTGKTDTVFYGQAMDIDEVSKALLSEGLYPQGLACIDDEVKSILGSIKIESTCGIGIADNNWPRVQFHITLTRHGSVIYSGPYSMGIGHFKPTKTEHNHSGEFRAIFNTKKAHPAARLEDKQKEAQAHAWIANFRKFKPSLIDVIPCLISSGDAYFNRLDFEEWTSELGYDQDSIQALDTYNACTKIGKELSKKLNPQEIEYLQEWSREQ